MPNDPKTSSEELRVSISYCPELGLYHYERSDGDEFWWDNEQLERSIETCIQDGKVV